MIPDIRTIILSYVLTSIVCFILMILLWRQNRGRFAGTLIWVVDYAFQLTAFALIVLRNAIPDWASIVAANALVVTGAYLGYLALVKFAGGKRLHTFNILFLSIIILAHTYLTYVRPDVELRTVNTSLGLLVMTFQCAWFALKGSPTAHRPAMRWVGAVFAAYSAISLLRIGHYFTLGGHRADFFAPNIFDATMMLVYQILFIALTLSVGLMYNKRLVAEIQTGEEKFSKAFHSSPYALSISKMYDGMIFEVNEGFARISGYSHDEIRQKSSIDLKLWVHDEDRRNAVLELSKNGRVRNREFRYRRKSGEIIVGLFSADVITINNEPCILSSIEDITEHQIMDEALRKSNIFLENLNNAMADAVLVETYPQRMIEYVNNATTDMLGYSKQEMMGQNSIIFYPDEDGYQHSAAMFQNAFLEKKNLIRFEALLKKKSGDTFPVILTATFFREGDVINKFIVIVQDITEQKHDNETIRRLNVELEQRVADRTQELRQTQTALLNLVDDMNQSTKDLQAAYESLEAVNLEMAAFSYSVSHDLRAPLRSIDGFSSALQEDYADQLDDVGKNYLARIRRATQTMGQLIDDLLNLSRVTKSDFYAQDFDWSEMVREIAESEQAKSPLGNLALNIQGGIVIRADQRLMNIAMTNLMDNAWKFTGKTPNPHIQLGCEIQNGKEVFFIRDNGVGFDMTYAGKIFGAFQRLHKSDEFPGTGIGLATVQRIINRHGGRIWVQSEPNRETTFFFTLGE